MDAEKAHLKKKENRTIDLFYGFSSVSLLHPRMLETSGRCLYVYNEAIYIYIFTIYSPLRPSKSQE